MAQLTEHWSSLLVDEVSDHEVVSSNPDDIVGLSGSQLNEQVQHP